MAVTVAVVMMVVVLVLAALVAVLVVSCVIRHLFGLCLMQGSELTKYMCHLCDGKFRKGNLLTKHLRIKHHYALPSGHKRFRFVCMSVLQPMCLVFL